MIAGDDDSSGCSSNNECDRQQVAPEEKEKREMEHRDDGSGEYIQWKGANNEMWTVKVGGPLPPPPSQNPTGKTPGQWQPPPPILVPQMLRPSCVAGLFCPPGTTVELPNQACMICHTKMGSEAELNRVSFLASQEPPLSYPRMRSDEIRWDQMPITYAPAPPPMRMPGQGPVWSPNPTRLPPLDDASEGGTPRGDTHGIGPSPAEFAALNLPSSFPRPSTDLHQQRMQAWDVMRSEVDRDADKEATQRCQTKHDQHIQRLQAQVDAERPRGAKRQLEQRARGPSWTQAHLVGFVQSNFHDDASSSIPPPSSASSSSSSRHRQAAPDREDSIITGIAPGQQDLGQGGFPCAIGCCPGLPGRQTFFQQRHTACSPCRNYYRLISEPNPIPTSFCEHCGWDDQGCICHQLLPGQSWPDPDLL